VKLTVEQWNKLLDNKEVKDISDELPNSFLVVYQVMRAKILWQGKKYLANAWAPPGGKTFVDLREVTC
jgi:hypothetical protein